MNFDDDILLQVLDFFVNRPDSSGTAQSIAFFLEKDTPKIEPALEFLVQTEILNKTGSENLKVYQFIPSLKEKENLY